MPTHYPTCGVSPPLKMLWRVPYLHKMTGSPCKVAFYRPISAERNFFWGNLCHGCEPAPLRDDTVIMF